MNYTELLQQFQNGVISLTEFVIGMKELGYEISSIRDGKQGLVLDCFDSSNKFSIIQTNYIITRGK
jgi:hypothetical protein